jgi:sugar/nucleoside kinase (ribokinase family)
MKVLAFGELLVRLSAPGYQRFLQTDSYLATYTGAEANICVFLSLNGVEAEFLTKLPDNEIAECSLAALHKYGVRTGHVLRGGDRMGCTTSSAALRSDRPNWCTTGNIPRSPWRGRRNSTGTRCSTA